MIMVMTSASQVTTLCDENTFARKVVAHLLAAGVK